MEAYPMITVIDKDGTEIPISSSNVPALVTNGPNDILVAIFRREERVWVLGPLSSLRKGDCFRKLSTSDKDEAVYGVVTPPTMHRNGKGQPPTIYLTGLELTKLSHLLPALPKQLPGYNRPMLSSHTTLLLESK